MKRPARHVVGVDDAPFPPGHRGEVMIVAAVYSGARLEGVLSGRVRRDGANATDRIASMIGDSRFAPQVQAVFVQGIAMAGFNVVDIHRLHRLLGCPVVAVSRRKGDLRAIRCALLEKVAGGARKWRLIERAGPMEPARGVWIQRAGIGAEKAAALVGEHARHGKLPEPLRTAHLIAAGVTTGESRQRA